MRADSTVEVWDPLVRIFHWLLAITFFMAYITEDDFQSIHNLAGYLMFSLIAGRILWGFIGSEHAKFNDFVVKPSVAFQYLKAMLKRQNHRHLGHNPAGAIMILLLLSSIIAITLTGMVTLGIDEQAGPLADWVQTMGWHDDDIAEDLHEFFANFTLLLVIFHVSGVIAESLLHRDNLIKAMLTGRKQEKL